MKITRVIALCATMFVSTLLPMISSQVAAQEIPSISGLLKHKTSYNYLNRRWQQQDLQLDLEANTALGYGDATVIMRFMADGQSRLNPNETPNTYGNLSQTRHNNSHGYLALREAYWELSSDQIFWRLGKQQIVWGEADGLKLLDVINPQSYREFILDDFDDSRIPLWMVNAEVSLDNDGTLQVLWIPDTSTHELATKNSPFYLSSPLLVPQQTQGVPVTLVEPNAPKKTIKDSDFGLRYSQFIHGWDLSFNYLYHFVDEPVFSAHFDGSTVSVVPEYKRSHLLGSSASNAFGDWTFRAELAYETNRRHRTNTPLPGNLRANQWSSVLGLDFQGWSDQFVSMQWFQSSVIGQHNDLVKSQKEDTLSLLWEMTFMNETLTLSWLQLHSLDNKDGLSRPKVRYNLLSNLDLIVSADRFYGDSNGIFGQFDQADRISMGFEWGF